MLKGFFLRSCFDHILFHFNFLRQTAYPEEFFAQLSGFSNIQNTPFSALKTWGGLDNMEFYSKK